MSVCQASHTTFQPTDEEWRCPKCGADHNSFIIEEDDEAASDECDKLHKNSWCGCSNCGYQAGGNRVAAALAKIHNVEVCPTCKGRGMVPKSGIET